MVGTQRNHFGAWAAVALALAVAAAALLALAATTPAEAAGRYKTVTRAFSNANPISIVDASPSNPYPSEAAVAGLKRGKVKDVNVRLKGYGHTWPEDTAVLLVGPTGKSVVAMSDAGGWPTVNGVDLVLDDEAAAPLPDSQPDDGLPIATGAYKPTQGGNEDGRSGNLRPTDFPEPAPASPYASALAAFDGTNPNGAWELYVLDDTPEYSGQFAEGWSVMVKARVLR